MNQAAADSGSGKWMSRLRHALSSSAELESVHLRDVSLASGARTIEQARLRDYITLQGVISMVTLNPSRGSRWLEADIDDGTGRVTLVWIGRRELPGITTGRNVRVTGRLTLAHGRRVMYNPLYTLLAP